MKTKQAKRRELFKELDALQKIMGELWVENALPLAWDEIEERFPTKPKKAKVTLYLDAEVLRWFRAMGKGFHARIAAVLRIYHLATVTGDVRRDDDPYRGVPERADYLEEMQENFQEKLFDLVEAGTISKVELEALKTGTNNFRDMNRAKEEVLRLLGRIEGED